MPGGSGSPVFNDLWQLYAIHHSHSVLRPGERYGTRVSDLLTVFDNDIRSDTIMTMAQKQIAAQVCTSLKSGIGAIQSIPINFTKPLAPTISYDKSSSSHGKHFLPSFYILTHW
jgi:hypothetical protein